MVKVSTLRGWGYSDNILGWELDVSSAGDVKLVYCKVCREFYNEKKMAAKSGAIRKQVEKFVKGTHVIKKVNFQVHISTEIHITAALRLKEKALISCTTADSLSNVVGANNQTTLLPYVRKYTALQRSQLTRKFQLAHYMAATGQSFKTYANFANFERKYRNVDLGDGYLTDKGGAEIASYISVSKRMKKITEPLNQGICHYYSVLMDGSSSVKILDEKELYVIKTCVGGEPKFQVMSLEEPDESNAEGLKNAFENSVSKMKFNFDRRSKEIGMCSDAAAVNVKLHKLLKPDMGEHYLLTLCPGHKVELALGDAFKISILNTSTEKDYKDIYYFFKKSPLRWKLFKRQALFLEEGIQKYKRPEGTRWVQHSVDSITSHLKNLPVFMAFCNQQIIQPHNKTMKDLKPKVQGIKNNISIVKRLLFISVKLDILIAIRPLSKTLQDNSLITPEFVTACKMTIENIERIRDMIVTQKNEMYNSDFFPNTRKIVGELLCDDEEIISERQSRSETAEERGKKYTFHGYLMKGDLDVVKEAVEKEFISILTKLAEVLKDRFSCFLEDSTFHVMATFLDTKAFVHTDVSDIYEAVNVIWDKFYYLLKENGCEKENLKNELRTLCSHVNTFFQNIVSFAMLAETISAKRFVEYYKHIAHRRVMHCNSPL